VNGSEVGGGSDPYSPDDVQAEGVLAAGHYRRQQKAKVRVFAGRASVRRAGSRRTGHALGLDRLVMILRNIGNIRDVIAFPKTQSGADLDVRGAFADR